ncbi:MAG: glycine--tRNA ligase subunit beta [Desulfonatronovibrio sp.]
MPDFVLEIGFEEMPARFLASLSKELKENSETYLQQGMINYQSIEIYSTPRRLCAYISNMAAVQESKQELITGPPASIAFDQENKLTKAGAGFARSQRVEEGDLFRHQTDKGEYLAVNKTFGGKDTIDVLPEICRQLVSKFNFPKKMRWADKFAFGRPIRWILAMLDKKTVDFTVSDVSSGSLTFGHRVLGPGPFELSTASDYFQTVENRGRIVLDPEKRRDMIRSKADLLAREVDGEIVKNEDLVWETSNLVEFPNPVLGKFDQKYLELPREVLLTSMETHQKSFGVTDLDNSLLPYFLTVINNDPQDIGLVRKGWERVLKARLEDAMFFWNTDKAESIESRQEKLERVVFLASLGSMGDKSRRLKKISGYICDQLGREDKETVTQAAFLCKNDLVSEMVGEFADLQGIMGGIYAGLAGYNDSISRAVYEHYLPHGPESDLPETIAGAIVSIADKADNLLGCFGLKKIPTGATDPYALRRQALGIIRIVLKFRLDLNLRQLFTFCSRAYCNVEWKEDLYLTRENLIQFICARLKAYWQGKGYDGKIVDAVLQAGSENILTAEKRLAALVRFSRDPSFEAAVLTFKRIDNIIQKQGKDSGIELQEEYRSHLFQDDYETRLARKIEEVLADWEQQWDQGDFEALFDRLHDLRPVVDEFFDNVMVMCDDRKLRQNRLNMLNILSKKLGSLADFSALQV